MIRKTPVLPLSAVTDSIGPLKVSTALVGPSCPTISVSAFVTCGRLEHEADDRDERDERREQGEHPVVGHRRRPVGEVVLLELLEACA